jgi:hypothetical protein
MQKLGVPDFRGSSSCFGPKMSNETILPLKPHFLRSE